MEDGMLFADVIIDISHEKLDRTFQYIIPARLVGSLQVGMMVYVPFGRGNSRREAYVVNITDQNTFELDRMKELDDIAGGRLKAEERLIALAAWIHANYGSTMNQALKTVLPVKDQVRGLVKKSVSLNVDRGQAAGLIEVAEAKRHVAQARLLRALLDDGTVDYGLLVSKLGIAPSTFKSLENKGVITIEQKTQYRTPISGTYDRSDRPVLNERQQYAVDVFCSDYDNGVRGTYYVHGVTGSGKTEVYMNMIECVLAKGRQVIMLIPEIALTYQTVSRFYRRFGDGVSILNSRMSKGERYDQFLRAKNGETQIMIGPRSALFTPFSDIGLIIMDEEHEGAYKSETSPRYHARETAIHIAEGFGASVVLGSATPSVTAYSKCMSGEYRLLELPSRVKDVAMPLIHTVDLRQELISGNRSMFSIKLQELIRDRLQKHEQVMLFLNKRGYAGFVSCRSCGHVMKCPHCDVSLTEHRDSKRLVCHYCGYSTSMVNRCPSCGSPFISGFRAGTQQVEEMVGRMFPKARVLRMDMDTTSGKDGHARILEAFSNREADILVGTQMIVKGHDFPNVTLVGVLAADMSLHAGNYMASERTFQLLVQAAGRAGRGETPGEVVIQTYSPDHYVIQAAASQDYREFYQQEIQYRTLLNYPPVCNMLLVRLSSRDEAALGDAVGALPAFPGSSQVIGPANANPYRLDDTYNKTLYVKSADYGVLVAYAQEVDALSKGDERFRRVVVQFDFNPLV
jgi:primosomal protein N' (replication factor Y)